MYNYSLEYNYNYLHTCTHCSVSHVARITGAVEISDSVIAHGILVTIIIRIQHTLVDVYMHGGRTHHYYT